MNQSEFREILRKNFQAFEANNQARVQFLRRYGSRGAWQAFYLVPVLLQVNHPDVPGHVPLPDVPCGLVGFSESMFAEAAKTMFARMPGGLSRQIESKSRSIKSLLLMGSVGSIGQTTRSDLDYWVCLDRPSFTAEELAAFRDKLDRITSWAQKKHQTEVNFYVIDLNELKGNTMTPQGETTEGEVAPLLLKEEFYRSFLWVAGQVPLWSIIPPNMMPEAYRQVSREMDQNPLTGFGGGVIDLGFPERPGPQEFLAAALWLSEKSEADPFKAVLKMILILSQVESGLNLPLPCDLIKNQMLASTPEELPVDHYAFTIRQVLDYSREKLEERFRELVRISAFYKVRGALGSGTGAVENPRSEFLAELIQGWGWDAERVDKFQKFSFWPEHDRIKLGQEMKSFLFYLYARISKRLRTDFPDQVSGDDEKLAQFKAKILARYSEHQAKVEDLPSKIHRETFPKSLTMIKELAEWVILGGIFRQVELETQEYKKRMIHRVSRAARAAAWLVHNRLFSPDLKIRILPRPGPVSLESMIELMEQIQGLFPPHKTTPKKIRNGEDAAGLPRLLVINLEESWHETRIITADLIHGTGWGEMRHYPIFPGVNKSEAETLAQIVEVILETGYLNLSDLHFFVPPGRIGRKMSQNVKVVLAQALGGSWRKSTGPSRAGRRTRLDYE